MRKYPCKKAYKITMLILSSLALIIALATLLHFALDGVRNKALFAIFSAFILLVPAVLIWFCVLNFNAYFVFFDDCFEYHTLKSTITIKAKNLRYYFYRDGVLSVFFVDDLPSEAQENTKERAIAQKDDEELFKIQVGGMGFISGAEEIIEWFSQNVELRPDGQALDDFLEITEKYDFATPENVANVLIKANFIAKALNIAGVLLGLWVAFYPVPYKLCIFLSFALPIAILPVLHFSRGFIHFDKKGNSIYPCVCLSQIASTFGLAWRMLNDISIQNTKIFLISSAVFFVLYLVMFLICQKEFSVKKRSDWLSVTLYSFYFAAYSLAAVCAIDYFFHFALF